MQSTIRSHDFKNRVPKSNSENDDGKNYKAWMLSVKDTLGNVNERPRNLSIYKVPNKLRRVKEDAYNPHLVSIGPFHASKQKLVAMKQHKWRYMLHFLRRATPPGTKYDVTSPAEAPLEECAKAISELEEVARACYAENINLDKNQLAEILLVDGCFILELFIKHADQNQDQDEEEEELDPIIKNLWMVPTLQHDLALLENQIPFVVLQTLFNTIQKLANMQFRVSLEKYVLLFFRSALNLSDKAIQYTRTADPLHIADLLHRVVYTPQSNRIPKEKIEWGFKRCATQLVESGIQFQPAVNKDRLLDIRFHEGVIIIPPLHIQEITDSVFRNLVAFEQCSVGCSLHMASYAWLMKILIRSSKDAELLRLKGIITSEVGGDEKVSTFFQSLCREIVFNDFYFSDLCEEVNNCKKSWLRWGRIKAAVKDRLDVLIQRQGNWSIYKVPNKLRRLKEDAYNPHLVSIGAFHASNHELAVMKEHKWHYMLHFLRNKHNALEECGKAISELEEVARACYDENIDLDDHQLVEILLVDGCFILELFIKHAHQNPDPIIDNFWMVPTLHHPDPIITNLWMVPTLQHDLALLENQIPFVVLQTLFNTIQKLANMRFRFSLEKYVLLFFCSALNLSDETIQYEPTADLLHIVDLLHRVVYTPPSNRNPARNLEGQGEIERGFKRCATKLVKSGIQFQRGVDKDRRLLDITFNRGVITIPPLHIQEITGSVFRNLVAFEQCSVGCLCHMASYAWLMKTLIRSSQDAELLRLKGIITNEVGGDEEVSTFFQSLCREVVVKDFCFCELCDAVNKYDKSWLHWGRIKAAVKVRWKGYIETLHNDYFNSPWTIISFFAALVLLCLTALQTYYSARSYYPR